MNPHQARVSAINDKLGLHLDASRWDLPEAEVELRRRVFWEVGHKLLCVFWLMSCRHIARI